MRYGIALPESVRPDPVATPRAYEAFAARARMPEIAVVWAREWNLGPAVLPPLRALGMEPVVYVTQRQPLIPVDTLLRFADAVGPTAVRLNQEPDGDWGNADWQDWETRTYTTHWSTTRAILRPAGIRLFWCPARPKRAHDAGWWPGGADIVGMDGFAWDANDDLAQRFANGAKQCERIAPGVPVWVGETGFAQAVPQRPARLRELATVKGVEVTIVLNLAVPGFRHDWTFSPAMERAFAGLPPTGGQP